MPLNTLNGAGLVFERSSRHATYNFSQSSPSLFRNQPRLPFEYYININLNNVGTAKTFISDFFNSADLAQIMPLVKNVDMPSMKIETTPLNQYNRKRLSQTKIAYEPIKMVFHDVADGKTLKFWDMYYRYYFADGTESGMNETKTPDQIGGTFSTEQTTEDLIAGVPDISTVDTTKVQIMGQPTGATNTNGQKSNIQNIVANTLDNHNFGFNLAQVQNVRNLIQTINIYQVHGGRFNEVTLVNPRISAFNHDVLSYATGDKTLEITFMFEYEYAYYTIQNMQLAGGESNNNSTIEQFTHGDFLELTNLSFTQVDPNFIESNNPLLQGKSPNSNLLGANSQSSLGAVTNPFTSNTVPVNSSASSLSGLINISPQPVAPLQQPFIQTRPFNSTATSDTTQYLDMNRILGNP